MHARVLIKKAANILALLLCWLVPLYIVRALVNQNLNNPIVFFFEPMLRQGVLSTCWFLWGLVFLYLLSPLLRKLFDNAKARRITTISLMIISLAVFVANSVMSFNGLKPIESYVPQSMRMWTNLAYYWLGGNL